VPVITLSEAAAGKKPATALARPGAK
jgi:hypothetical protein